MTSAVPTIRLVIFDWAGTIMDFGSNAPVAAFVRVFADRGVEVSRSEARKPMGMHKKDHLLAMLMEPEIAARFKQVVGREWTNEDVEVMYKELVPRQLETIEPHSTLVPGLLECVSDLRGMGIQVGGSTGYFHAATDLCLEFARKQGYVPDVNICGDDVPKGRPAPWMIYRLMERTGVYPGSCVLKVGDTFVDIEEGRNAGTWSVAVLSSSSEMGLTFAEYSALSPEDRRQRLLSIGKAFLDAGAHAVIDSIHDVPGLVGQLNDRLARGEKP